jgi:RNA polymerase sigma-70 factor (ECF subfamily)
VTDRIVPTSRGHSSSTSLSLLDRATAGDREAWERIVYLYSPLVDRWCRRKHLDEDEIQDVGQVVFLTLYMSLGRFRKEEPGDGFRKWLKTMTKNKVIDYLRKERNAPVALGGSAGQAVLEAYPDEPSATEGDDEDDEEESEDQILLRRCLQMVKSEFEPRTFAAFWAVVVDVKPPAEVARSLGMKSVGAVYTAKSRVTRRLREVMDQLEEDLPEL